MANILTSYYVPKSLSESYVESKRDPESGAKIYQSARQEVGIEKQAALQNLQQQYDSTISNAYASYVANQRAINKSNLFQGYKDIYRQAQDEALMQQVAQTNLSAANARQEINESAATALSDIEKAKSAETTYLNRVSSLYQQYLDYVDKLTPAEGIDKDIKAEYDMYVNPNDENKQLKTVDQLYETLYNLQPRDYRDETGQAKSFNEWVKANLTGSSEDQAYGDWFFGGGITDFMNAVNKTRAQEKLEAQAKGELKSYTSPYGEGNTPEGYEGFVKEAKGVYDYRKGDIVKDENGTKYEIDEVPKYDGTTRNNAYSNWKDVQSDLNINDTNGMYVGTIVTGKSGQKYLYAGMAKGLNKLDYPVFIKIRR